MVRPDEVTRATNALADERSFVKVQALLEIAEYKIPVPIDRIYAALNDPDSTVRSVAGFTLSKVGDSTAVPYLLNAWKATDPRDTQLLRQILLALGDIGGARAFEQLLESFAEWDAELQELALGFLAEKGESDGFRLLKELMGQDLSSSVRSTIDGLLSSHYSKMTSKNE